MLSKLGLQSLHYEDQTKVRRSKSLARHRPGPLQKKNPNPFR
jgi:hypothetical protein